MARMWYKAKKLILHVYKLPRQGIYKVKGGGRKENEGGDRVPGVVLSPKRRCPRS